MNNQTRALRKLGLSTSGTQPGAMKSFEVYQGKLCPTSFGTNPESKRKSPRKGKHTLSNQ